MKIFISLFLSLNILYSASFNCSKAETKTEKAICSEEYLNRYDEKLNKSYKKLQKQFTKEKFKSIKNEQISWLEKRNICKENTSCIAKLYLSQQFMLEKIYPLEIAIINHDYSEIFELTNNRGIKTSAVHIESSKEVQHFFDRLFPENIVSELKNGRHFKVEFFSNQKYPFYETRRLSLNDYSFIILGDDGINGFTFREQLPIAHFEKPEKDYSILENIILQDSYLIKDENIFHDNKTLIRKASLTDKESEKLITEYENKINICLNTSNIKECLKITYKRNLNDMMLFIEKRKNIFYKKNGAEISTQIPIKFKIIEQWTYTYQSPGYSEDFIDIDLTNNSVSYKGTVLPDFKRIWIGTQNPTVVTIDELIYIFTLAKPIHVENETYNAIIVKSKNIENPIFYLAHISNNPHPYERDTNDGDNKDYTYVFEMGEIESK